jgi:hypothetical protein
LLNVHTLLQYCTWIQRRTVSYSTGFADICTGAYQNHAVHITLCTSIPQPVQQEGEMRCWDRRHFTQFIFLADGATWSTASEQASYTAPSGHRLGTYYFIHIYLVVLTVIEIQMRYTVKQNILMRLNSLLHVAVHKFKS